MHVFISYRWTDSGGFTRALADRLMQRLGKSKVFLDVETVPGGADFRQTAHTAIDDADAVLVVIGPGWLDAAEGDARRLDSPNDLVRREVARALGASPRVIPVLVDGAKLPRREELPADIAGLVDRNAVEVSNTRFDTDVDRLVRQIARGTGARRLALWSVGFVAIVVATAGLLLWVRPSRLFLPALATVGILGAAVLAALLRAISLHRGSGPNRLAAAAVPLVWIVAVMVIGWRRAPGPLADTFTLVVRVHGPSGPADLITQGLVAVELGEDRRRIDIGSNGQAVFPGVPIRFQTEAVRLLPEVEGYEAALGDAVTIGDDGIVDLALVKATYATEVRGTVVGPTGTPIAGVALDFDSGRAVAITDSLGSFRVKLPVPPGTVMPLRATHHGVTGYHDRITVPASTSLTVPFSP